MILIDFGIILVFLVFVGSNTFNSQAQPYLEFKILISLCVAALGNALFGYSIIWFAIQMAGVMAALYLVTFYRNSNESK